MPKTTPVKAELMPVIPKTTTQMISEWVSCLKSGEKTLDLLIPDLSLTPQEVDFCQKAAIEDPETFGDYKLAAMQAFGINDSKKAYKKMEQLLNKKNIQLLIHILHEIQIDDPRLVERELHWLIKQRINLPAKAKAIQIYSDIKGKVNQTITHNHIHTNLDYTNLSDKELIQMKKSIQKMEGKSPNLIEDADQED